jgi:peptide-methionine (S)-S-oxide reductase
VGYTGGQQDDPTYFAMHDHTEALKIEFDPSIVSYRTLLLEWAGVHNPVRKTTCQYRSALWYLNQAQKDSCEDVVKEMKSRLGEGIFTSVEPTSRFYLAEEFHQNFRSKMIVRKKL